jgi:hypothetical protein
MKDTSLPSKVANNTTRFRSAMKNLGFTVSVSELDILVNQLLLDFIFYFGYV